MAVPAVEKNSVSSRSWSRTQGGAYFNAGFASLSGRIGELMVASQTPKIRCHKALARSQNSRRGLAPARWNSAVKDDAHVAEAAQGALSHGSIAAAAALGMQWRIFLMRVENLRAST